MEQIHKPSQVRLRITEADDAIINQIAGSSVLSKSDVASFVLHAGLEAIRANGGRFQMPLEFCLGEFHKQKEKPRPKRKAA